MSAGRSSPACRALRLVAVACVALLLSGCVYLRLLQLKRQLADFDENFAMQTSSGLRLNFLKPILTGDDIAWLGFEPATRTKLGVAERWDLRWVKELPPGIEEKGGFEIAFELIFTQEKLSGLNVSETYFALVPKPIIVAGIKSLGRAKVDKKTRSVAATVDESTLGDVVWPSQRSVTAQLGRPTDETIENGRRIVRYRFVGVAPPDKKPGGKPNVIDLKLTFDIAQDQLLKTEGRTPVGNIDWDFKPPAPKTKS